MNRKHFILYARLACSPDEIIKKLDLTENICNHVFCFCFCGWPRSYQFIKFRSTLFWLWSEDKAMKKSPNSFNIKAYSYKYVLFIRPMNLSVTITNVLNPWCPNQCSFQEGVVEGEASADPFTVELKMYLEIKGFPHKARY